MSLAPRHAARRSLAFAAVVALSATLTATAHAQEPDAPVVTSTTQTETTTTTTTTAPAATTTTTTAAATAAKLAISAAVVGGPFLVGEEIPVEVTITNTGDADATAVKAGEYSLSGSYFYVSSDQWGDLSTWRGAGVTVPAGKQHVVTVHGQVQQWTGANPVAKFYLQLNEGWAGSFDLTIPLVAPDTGKDTVAGLIYGDRNGNHAPDAGEGLAGIAVELSASGERISATTDAQGRFRFDNVPVRVYTAYIVPAPGGWVVEQRYHQALVVDGSGSASDMVLRAVRPLADRLSASMRFTQPVYELDAEASIEVTLTNSGAEDITGIKAGCDRSGGEGPELRDVDLGDMEWNASGVTVRAGETRTFTFTGRISEENVEYGAVHWPCDFGPGDSPEGHPIATAWARVVGDEPSEPGDLTMVFYHDRNRDWTAQPDEKVADLVVGVADAATGALVTKSRTDAEGRVTFEDIPAGPYEIRVYGAWKFDSDWPYTTIVGDCERCSWERSATVVPNDVPTPEEEVTPTTPAAPTTGGTPATTAPAPASAGGGLADTGASVFGLIGLGALALLGGLGAVLVSRRKRAA